MMRLMLPLLIISLLMLDACGSRSSPVPDISTAVPVQKLALSDLVRVHGMKVERVHGGSHPFPLLGRPMAWLDARHSTYANIRCSPA